MPAFTFSISFFTAHFKQHTAKRFRDTYIIPLPSSIVGIFGAILGVRRENLLNWSNDILCGAKIIGLDGFSYEYVKLWKFKEYSTPISTPERVKIMINPEYVIAVASDDERKINELYERIDKLKFEFDVFGGSDYHFVKNIGKPREGKIYRSNQGEGYVPTELISSIIPKNSDTASIYTAYVRAKIRKNFTFVWKGLITVSNELQIVDDGKERIFVYKARDFLSI